MLTLGLRLSVHGIAYAVNKDNAVITSGLLRLITKPDDMNEHMAGRNPPGRVERRLKRQARRNNERKKRRVAQVRKWIANHLHTDVDQVDPGTATKVILHRERAISQVLSADELAVVLLTCAKRRGWKLSEQDDEDELGEFLAQVERNSQAATEAGGIGAFQAGIYRTGKRVRTRTYFRAVHEAEFVRIAQVQATKHPAMTGETLTKLRRIIFHQRPLKSVKGKVGRCAYEPDRPVCNRLDPYFQTLRVHLDVENFRIYDPYGNDVPIPEADLDNIRQELLGGKTLTPARLLKLTGHKKGEVTIKWEKGLAGHETRALLKGSQHIGDEDLYHLWQVLHSVKEPEARRKGINALLGEGVVPEEWLALKMPRAGYSQYSHKAVRKLLEHLRQGTGLFAAMKRAGYATANKHAEPELRGMNLVQQKFFDHLQRLVKQLEEDHGPADRIVLAADRMLTAGLKARQRMARDKRMEDKKLKQLMQDVHDTLGPRELSGKDKQRLLLWDQCGGISPFEPGRPITLSELIDGKGDNAITVDHIVPYSRLFDDSPGNKVLARRKMNKDKGDATALEFMRKQGVSAEAFAATVEGIRSFDGKELPKPKQWKLMTEQENIPRDFVTRGIPRGSMVRASDAAFGAGRTLWAPMRVASHLVNRWQLPLGRADLRNHVYHAMALTVVSEEYMEQLDKLTDHPGESLRHVDMPAFTGEEPAARLHHYRRSSFRGKNGRMEPKVALHQDTHYGNIVRELWLPKQKAKGMEVLEQRGDLARVRKTEVVVRYPVQGLVAKDLPYVVDAEARKVLVAHLKKYKDNAEKAWANYEEDPPLFHGCAMRHVRLLTGRSKVRTIKGGQYTVVEGVLDHLAVYRDANGKLGFEANSPLAVAERRRAGEPLTLPTHPQKGELLRVVRYGDVFTVNDEPMFVNTIDGDSGRCGFLPVMRVSKEAVNVSLRKVLETEEEVVSS